MIENLDDLIISIFAVGFSVVILLLAIVVLRDDGSTDLERAEVRYGECIARENTEQFCIEYSLDN
jgi:hypothetical protein